MAALAPRVAGAALFPFAQVLHRALGALAATAFGLRLLLLLGDAFLGPFPISAR